MAWRVSPTLSSYHSTEQLCSSYKLQQYSGSPCFKCLSLSVRANSRLCQQLDRNSCGIIIDCAVTTSVTLKNRLESQNHSFWSRNLWRQLHWLTPRSFLRLLSSLKIIFSFIFLTHTLTKAWVLWELLGLLKEQTGQLQDAQDSSQYCTRTTWKVPEFIYLKCQWETTESVPYITYPVGLLDWFTPVIGKQALFSTVGF